MGVPENLTDRNPRDAEGTCCKIGDQHWKQTENRSADNPIPFGDLLSHWAGKYPV